LLRASIPVESASYWSNDLHSLPELHYVHPESDLLQLRAFPELRSVSLTHMKLTEKGCGELCRLTNLEEAHLGETRVPDIGVLKIVRSCRRLKVLDLYAANLTNPTLCEILASPNIQKVDATSTKVSGKCEDLISSGVEELVLKNSQADDSLVKSLSVCHRVKILDLYGTRVTDQSVPALMELKSLEVLEVGDTSISESGIQQLQTALPNCWVRSNPSGSSR
jgi:internalin A